MHSIDSRYSIYRVARRSVFFFYCFFNYEIQYPKAMFKKSLKRTIYMYVALFLNVLMQTRLFVFFLFFTFYHICSGKN